MCDPQLESYDPDNHPIQEPYEWEPNIRSIPQSTFPGEQPKNVVGQLSLMDEVIAREIGEYFT